jgi:hypothetical protein
MSQGFRAGSSQNFTVSISLIASFPFAFCALFTVAAPVFLEHVVPASSQPCKDLKYGEKNFGNRYWMWSGGFEGFNFYISMNICEHFINVCESENVESIILKKTFAIIITSP